MMTLESHTDPLLPERRWNGLRVAVLGLGRSGLAASRLLLREGVEVEAFDDQPESGLRESVLELRDRGLRIHFDARSVELPALEGWAALVVSPGVAGDHPLLRAATAAGLPVLSELELASRRVTGPVIAVTGTNGKSTTVTLVHRMLQAAGRDSRLAGNIGRAFCDQIEEADRDTILVVEASSFQLERIVRFHPRCAAVLNLAPDHLDRYRDLSEYSAVKARIVENLEPSDRFVYPLEDPRLAALAAGQRGRPLGFGIRRGNLAQQGAWIEGKMLMRRGSSEAEPILSVAQLPLLGAHNHLNVLAALCLVDLFDLAADAVATALREFAPLPHRAVMVLESEGIRWIDDSKATNVHAACASLDGLQAPLILLLGGSAKGEDYRPLRDRMHKVKIALCYGSEGPAIARALRGSTAVQECGGLIDALEQARKAAERGDTVLLSPACASFDEFTSFEERGEVFARWVRSHGKGSS